MTISENFAQLLKRYIYEMDIGLTTLDGKDISPEELERLKPRKGKLKPFMREYDPEVDATDAWEPHALDPQIRKKREPSVEDLNVNDVIIDRAIRNQNVSTPEKTNVGNWMAKFVLATNANDIMANRVADAFRPVGEQPYGSIGTITDTWETDRERVASHIMINMYKWYAEDPKHRTLFKKALIQMDDDVLSAMRKTFKTYKKDIINSGIPLDYVDNFMGNIQIAGRNILKGESVNESYISDHLKKVKKILKAKNAIFR